MKSNFNLPKIQRDTLPNYTGLKGRYDNDDFHFPRNQHPDTRTNKEFLDMLDKKFGKITKNERWYPGKKGKYGGNNRRLLYCETNGKIYESVLHASEDLALCMGNFAKHLRGEVSHVGGFKFNEIK